MAKSKKAGANSSSYGKKKVISDKKPVKKVQPKLNETKVKNISKKIKEINNNFECLIGECRAALNKLNETLLATTN